jgi:RNA polymerase sigma-70 factor (ECF subfamily)
MEPLALSDLALERIEELGGGADALRLLGELPEDQRRAISGRVLEQRDYADIAEQLSCSQSVVRQRVSRGLRSIRDRLEEAQ